MLKKGFRLKKKEDFDRVFRSGRPLFFEEIGCRYVKNTENKPKVGFSLSKKYVPTAVERNRLKRTFSETLRILFQKGPSEGVDIVFFLTKRPRNRTKEAIQQVFNGFLRQIYPN